MESPKTAYIRTPAFLDVGHFQVLPRERLSECSRYPLSSHF